MPYKIIQKQQDCIGCGACVSVCPENWEIKNNKAKPKNTQINELSCNQKAAEVCPVQCIKIKKI